MNTFMCPNCRSQNIVERNLALKTMSAIGAVAGAALAAVTTFRLDKSHEGEDTLTASLAAGLAVGSAGAKLGAFIDQHLLDNLVCQACGSRFGVPKA